MAQQGRDLRLRIRADDATAPGVRSAETSLKRLKAAQDRTQARRDQYASAVAATRDLSVGYDQARTAATRLGKEVRAAGLNASGEQVAAFKAARAAVRETRAEYDKASASLARLRNTGRGGFAGLDARALGGGASLQAVTARATKGGFLGGLRPHEVTNLSYQVNDLITQIASGTSPMQAFAQQGGQIAQIFPKATGALLRFSPVLAAIGLAVSPLIVGFKQLNDEATRLSGVDNALKVSGNAADYSRTQLADYAKTLQDMGIKAKDTAAVINANLRDAVDPAYLTRFATAARGLSKITGEDLADSIKTVSQAFTGNADEVLALDDQLGFLTATERKHIEQLRESKKDAEARTEAFAIFERRYGDIAAKMDGSWSQILSNFGDAWGAFGKWMLDGIQWDAIKREMGEVIALVARLSAMLPAVDKNSARYLRQRHGEIDAEIRRNQDRINRGLGDIPTNGLPGSSDAYSNIARLEEERDQVLRKLFAAEGRLATAPDTTTRPPRVNRTSPGRVALPRPTPAAREDNSAEIADQNALKAIEAARLDLAQRRGEIESRADFIARQTAERLNDATAERKAEFGEIVGQLYDMDAAARRLGDAEKSTNDLLQLRGALIAEMQTAADTGDQLRVEELRQRVTDVNAQLVEAARAALALMAGLAGPEAELARFSLETLLRDAGLLTDQLAKVGAKAVVSAEDIDEMIVGGGVNAFDDFSQGLAEGANAFDAMRDAFLRFAADFLRQIALMIVQRAIFNALGGADGSSIGKGVSGFVNGLFGSKHTGGLVGSGGMFRSVSPAVFAGATRYHSGGLVGLAPNEVPIIAKRNEEVLTESDPRHRANGGGFGGARSIKVTNVFDPGDILSKGLTTESGEASFWNFVRANSQQFKANLG
ncbi:phage tail length tape measure family protein [Brevundimonas sp. VNH65]|uniref:phage tail length tape measure family protein n=1 Tax=Brevundimonas sp. VNH65 TaxID=3400917 RepID=UPI003C0C82AA